VDMAAGKLLANADRWADDAVFSRDLIDLAMMVPPRATLHAALSKAQVAYGESVRADLLRAVDRLRKAPLRLDQCMRAMRMDTVPRAMLWQRIRNLEKAVR
jgi:hypothetical protein